MKDGWMNGRIETSKEEERQEGRIERRQGKREEG
jgi:hypothetical protein